MPGVSSKSSCSWGHQGIRTGMAAPRMPPPSLIIPCRKERGSGVTTEDLRLRSLEERAPPPSRKSVSVQLVPAAKLFGEVAPARWRERRDVPLALASVDLTIRTRRASFA